MTQTWFTSDLHLGHPHVAELRGFSDTEAHDTMMAMGWAQVRPADIVWVLGDIAVQRPQNALDILSILPGRKRLIAGNHDPVHPMHRDSYKWTERFLNVFEGYGPYARTKLHGVEMMLCHFPYERDRGEPRYQQYRLPDLGLPLLHGHLHTKDRLVGRELHVGVDAWNFNLVPTWQVLDLLQSV